MISVANYPSRAAAIRAYHRAHPEERPVDVARALGVDTQSVCSVLGKDRRAGVIVEGVPAPPSPNARAARLLPMLPGPGDRREGCAGYDECLTRAAVVGGEAHCPAPCPSYSLATVDHIAAAMVPRVQYATNAQGGRLW